MNMTAHPKVDPETGELLMFGYDVLKPFLTIISPSADGDLVESRAIELARAGDDHDFAVPMRRHVVFMDLPIQSGSIARCVRTVPVPLGLEVYRHGSA